MRAVRPLVLTVSAALLTAPLVPVAAHAATSPTVAISAPTSASTVVGKVTITVEGNVDAAERDAAQTTLLVNGTALGVASCGTPVVGANCPTSFTWDSTELNGSYTLSAHIAAPSGSADSTVTVTAANPLPQVSISSPGANAVVKGGNLSVHATGSVDLSQSDQPTTMQLWLDGVKYGLPQNCVVVISTAQTCDEVFTVHQPGWTGSHAVQVTMATKLTSSSSATVPALFFTGTKTSLQPVATVRAGRKAVIRGSVTAVSSGAGLGGARVVVTIAPAIGKKRSLVLHTGSTGHFSLSTAITANSTVTATVTGARDIGSSHATAKVKALAPIVCKADLAIRHGRYGAGTCTVAHLPDGTGVSLQYQSKKKWHVLGTGTTSGTSIPVSYTFGAPGSYPVRLVLSATKVYATTYGTPFTVKVS